jgi:Oxidoreductase family, NAD-binding Rossmann fold
VSLRNTLFSFFLLPVLRVFTSFVARESTPFTVSTVRWALGTILRCPEAAVQKIDRSKPLRKIRYAVVGLGYISQIAVLPAFAHAKENSELTALVSSDPQKLRQLSRKYKVRNTYSYEQYSECLRSGEVEAVYIGLPNHMHRAYSEAAAQAGIHVLCEKPMAFDETECEAMIAAAEKARVKLMIAYRYILNAATSIPSKQLNPGKSETRDTSLPPFRSK